MRKTVEYKGVNVVYSQIGSGQTIVLLHGFLEERSMWDAYVSELKNNFKVITIDLLGQGETSCLGYVHSMEDHAAAVATVLFTENVENCAVVGHSMGGYVGLALAEKQPDLIKKLVLLHSTAFADGDERKKDRERVIKLAQRNKDVYVRAVIPSLFAERIRERLKPEIQSIIDIACGFTDQGIIANIRGMMERKDRSGVLRTSAFEKLIIHGELDEVISIEDAQLMANLSETITFELVKNISHMGHLEASEVCLILITEFCKD